MLFVAAMLAVVAVVNGYPLVFQDSARYLDGGIRHFIPNEAPIFYGVFMIPLHLDGVSLWPVVIAQCLIGAHLIRVTLRLFDIVEERDYLLTALFLVFFSTAPWFMAFVMPDFFTGVCVLSMYVLFRGWNRLRRIERVYFIGLAVGALACHISHIPLGLCLSLVFVALALLGRAENKLSAVVVPILPLVALSAVLGMNVLAHGQARISQDGNVFLFARVFADGPGAEYMRDNCAERQWRLCAVLDRLPRDSEAILWDKTRTIWSVAPPQTVRAEAGSIAMGAIFAHPGEMLIAAAKNSLHQLLAFRVGVDLPSYAGSDSYINPVMHQLFAREVDQFLGSKQQRGCLDAGFLNSIYLACIVVSLLGTAGILMVSRFQPGLTEFVIVVVAGILGNAIATGAFSGVHDRYQARIVWLIPLVFAVSLFVYRKKRATEARGFLAQSRIGGEVVVADNGSTDEVRATPASARPSEAPAATVLGKVDASSR